MLYWANLGETTSRICRDEGQQPTTLFSSALLAVS
jgi:hypothetical protein